MRPLGCLLAGLVPALLAGCAGGLLPGPPAAQALFLLDDPRAASATPRTSAPGAPVLLVLVPRPAAGYDGTPMLYLRGPQELERFAFHAWAEPPAQMLAPLLVRALQDSAAFRAVLLVPSAATGAWRLETELIRLHQDFGTRPSRIRLTLRAVLLDSRSREVIAWREFDQAVPAASDDPAGGVAAARQAAAQVAAALAAFCAERAAQP